ncbi:DNA ligase 4 [Schizopora paradoxa]|uniref:DNA ligase n=1 Tax=Schizopora paradoxa TaxID=27342 RepID=A0A0H2RTA1_9AGAM|nr:DNA ligase 4 [Schizopora paradoxa]
MSRSPSPSGHDEQEVANSQNLESQQSQAEIVNNSYPEPPVNSKSVPFQLLASLYEYLQNERKPEKRRNQIAKWFARWRSEVGNDLYPVLRLLLPQKDRERSVYGLKEKNLAKAYIKLIPLNNKDPDAIRLQNWKRPTDKNKTAGDFPTVLYEVISKRSSVIEGTLTIDDVNQVLDDLSKDMGKQEVQAKVLQRLYNKTTPQEQKWIARIILKDMIISVKENTVFSIFHPDAHDLFNTCSDLKKVAYQLWNPEVRLNDEDKSIQLFRAFAPMLCKRPSSRIEDTLKEMGASMFYIEEKLDGERMQLHKRGNEFFYCSRKGKDYTYLYGSHVGTGSLTPFISGAFDERIEEVILDGEMLVYDPASDRNLPFGTLKTAALDTSKGKHNPRPCFKIFDILYLNGQSLAKRSVKYRKRNLTAYVKEVKGRMEYVTTYEGKNANDVRRRLEEVMENRGEGLILKHPDAQYVLNGRNKDWVKIKPEYMDNMGETVDVLVVGGNFGSGKRSGGVSTLICAVLDDRKANDDDEPKYSTFVRIGSGLTYTDYVWVRSKPWKPFDKNKIPSWYQNARRSTDDKGDVYLEPEDSFILKVKAAEITPSDQYHLGFTMRFPRALSIREDLSIADCMTATAVLESMKTERKRKMENKTSNTKKKRKTVKNVTVMTDGARVSLKGIQAQTNLFKGMKFLVASDPQNRDGDEQKKEIVKLVKKNGGSLVQVTKGLDPILVVYNGTVIPYDLKLIINKDMHDIIRPQWLYDCIDEGELVPLRQKYFFHATAERHLDKDFAEQDDIDDDDEPRRDAPTASSSAAPEPERRRSVDQERSEIPPELQEWFGGGEEPAEGPDGSESVTESEAESNYDEATIDDDDMLDEFRKEAFSSKVPDSETEDETEDEAPGDPAGDVKMGENEDAMEYDQEKIFRHLCFYLDTPQNAEKNGMVSKSKHAAQITTSFGEIEDIITENGGRIVALEDPKLTHVVIDKRDDSRRKELSKRTSTPKRRQLVVSDFIHACIDENTLLDEEEFAP